MTFDALPDVAALVAARDAPGTSAPARVAEHCARVRAAITAHRRWAARTRTVGERAETALIATARALAAGSSQVE